MKPIIAIFAALTLSACATLTAEGDQVIEVTTNPPGANCVLSNSQGAYSLTSPGSVIVERAFEPLGVTCTLAGVGSASTILESKTRGRAYGNILLGGVPAIFDAQNGPGYEYDPANVTLELVAPQPQLQ